MKNEKYEEEVYLCSECLKKKVYSELYYDANDIDGFMCCDRCEKTDFIGDIKSIPATKTIETIVVYKIGKIT